MKTAMRTTRSGLEIRLGDWIHLFDKDGKYFDSAKYSELSPMDRALEAYKWRAKTKQASRQKDKQNEKRTARSETA